MITSGWPIWRRTVGALAVLTGQCIAVPVRQPRYQIDADFRMELIREVPGIVGANFWENYGKYRLYLELVHGSVVYVAFDKKVHVGVKDDVLMMADEEDCALIRRFARVFREHREEALLVA